MYEAVILEKNEGITYINAIISLMPDCSLKKELQFASSFLSSLKGNLYVVPINPLNNFPSIGSLLGQNQYMLNSFEKSLETFEGIDGIINGAITAEHIQMAKTKENGEIKTRLFTVLDSELGIEFKFWPTGKEDIQDPLLLVYSTKDETYKFFSKLENGPYSIPTFSIKENDGSLSVLGNNLSMLQRLSGEILLNIFLEYSFDKGFSEAKHYVSLLSDYVGVLLEYSQILGKNQTSFLSGEFFQTLISKRDSLKSEAPKFFEATQTKLFLENVRKYGGKENDTS